MFNSIRVVTRVFAIATAAFLLCFSATAQKYDAIEKGRMKDILKIVKSDIKDKYYDPTYRGIDLEARFKAASDKLDQASSVSQALAIIAQAVVEFNDSHLYFIPPSTSARVDYGWRSTYMGDRCIITDVKPGSDAEAKGLKPGDEIVSISGFRLSRKEMWKVLYYYNVIGKRTHLVLSVLSPGSTTPRDLDITAEIKQQPRVITFNSYFRLDDDFYNEKNDEHRFVTVGGVNVWRMPGWDFDPDRADALMAKVKNGSSLIMDLRGNGGGYVTNLETIAGYFVAKDTPIAELKGRKKMDPQKAKSKGENGFKGKLVVLIDSESGSASEIFARFVQIEKLGTVIGDVSAGAVMQSMSYGHEIGGDNVVPFAVSVTNADVIMSDGKSIEHTGVIPDELLVPSPADVAAGRDVAMARAFEVLGGKVDPVEAGKWFPYFWKKG